MCNVIYRIRHTAPTLALFAVLATASPAEIDAEQDLLVMFSLPGSSLTPSLMVILTYLSYP